MRGAAVPLQVGGAPRSQPRPAQPSRLIPPPRGPHSLQGRDPKRSPRPGQWHGSLPQVGGSGRGPCGRIHGPQCGCITREHSLVVTGRLAGTALHLRGQEHRGSSPQRLQLLSSSMVGPVLAGWKGSGHGGRRGTLRQPHMAGFPAEPGPGPTGHSNGLMGERWGKG